jgi:hypothetical protein
LIGVQNLLTASFWIGMGSRVMATLTSAGATTIALFAIGGMSIAYESVALTVRTVKGDCHHERLLFLKTD